MLQMKIENLIRTAVLKCLKKKLLDFEGDFQIEITTPKLKEHGDFATGVALALAGRAKLKPRDVAEKIVSAIPSDAKIFSKIEIAGPGFINFTVNPDYFLENLSEIYEKRECYGRMDLGHGKKVQVEFVSANPTGPLHIGHGRGAVYGDVLANIFKALGYDVTKEYYVNDTGGQIRTLGRSVYLRFKELEGENIDFPKECYQGHYIREIARTLRPQIKAKAQCKTDDELIEFCGEFASAKILDEIKRDLAETGVIHDIYFFENKLHSDALVETTIARLREKGHVYDNEGAIWFKSTDYGDDKDRVLKKGDGLLTYFAADIAYHRNKYERGFHRVIDVWGADHGGYVARMKAAVEALGYDPKSFDAVLIQLVNLMRAGEAISMSTRSATYETLEDVRKEVGRDACRYFFLMRSHNAQLDFDLDLAKKESSENPVYYIQYAHARIESIFRKADEKGVAAATAKKVDLKLLDLPEESKIARMLLEYPSVLFECTVELEPHKLAFYLLELARIFQSYYSKGRSDEKYMVVTGDKKRSASKLYLLKNIQIVLKNGLNVLGVSAPAVMSREDDV